MPNTSENQMPFVKRFEMAVMQYVILDKAKSGEVTRENLKQTFRGNLQMSSDHFDHCVSELVQDGHLQEIDGGKYKASDDGREDIHKLESMVLELSDLVHQGSRGQQGQGMTPQRQAAGAGSASGSGGSTSSSSTGSTMGTQGNYGTSKPQGRDVGAQQGSTMPGDISNKSGVSGQQKTGDVNKGGATRTER